MEHAMIVLRFQTVKHAILRKPKLARKDTSWKRTPQV